MTHCNRFCVKLNPKNTKERQKSKNAGYLHGHTWCVICSIYMTIPSGSRCPCCHYLTRQRPRASRSRAKMEHKRY